MERLIVNFKDRVELLTYFDKLKEIIQAGYTSGTLLDGWDIAEIEEE